MTGLPTSDELSARAWPSATPFAVFFDVDQLIWLGDWAGWQAQDEALICVAGIIRDAATKLGCSAYRIGGDEFLVVLDGHTHLQAMALAREVLAAVTAAGIDYRRSDDPSRKHLAMNAIVSRVSDQIVPRRSQVGDWIQKQVWEAKGHERLRFSVIGDAGDDLPSWAMPDARGVAGYLLEMDATERKDPPHDDHALLAGETLARWLDDRYLDPLLGLFLPGVGDLLGSALGLYPVLLAWKRRAPKALIARMLLNLAADAAGGAIPILGDIWDFLFKAHARNLALLRSRAAGRAFRSHWSDNLVVAFAVVVMLAAFALPVLVAIGLWHLLGRALGR